MNLRTIAKMLRPLIIVISLGATGTLIYWKIDTFYLLMLSYLIGAGTRELLKHLEQ